MKKGFTLVEMLGVILILSILVVVGNIAISKIIDDSKIELTEVQKKLIIEAAKSLANDNVLYLPSDNKCKYITLEELYYYDYFENEILNPSSNESYSDIYVSVCASLNQSAGKIVYSYDVNFLDENKKPETGMNPFFLAEPDLYNNSLTPVVYVRLTYENSSHTGTPVREVLIGTEVITTALNTEVYEWQIPYEDDIWYDYDNQMWANAVLLNPTVRDMKQPGDSVDVDISDGYSDALGMYVWIPRYSYTVKCQDDNYTTCRGNYEYASRVSAPTSTSYIGAIDIRFVSTKTKNRGTAKFIGSEKKNWHTLPAFSLIDNGKIIEIDGLWIGKFIISAYNDSTNSFITTNLSCYTESCGSESKLKTLPYTIPLVNNPHASYYNLFNSYSKFYDVDLYLDTHVIKNSEWSSMAYLSRSLYGKYGNYNYKNEYKNIYRNNSGNLKTGKSNGNIETYQYCYLTNEPYSNCTTQFNYDYIFDSGDGKGAPGAGASTTGTIYGIYDTLGSALEYTMLNANNYPANSAFTTEQLASMSQKYIDKYNISSGKCNDEECIGYGFDITTYNISGAFDSNHPFCVRGSYAGGQIESLGVFTITQAMGPGTGNGGPHNSVRMAIFKST